MMLWFVVKLFTCVSLSSDSSVWSLDDLDNKDFPFAACRMIGSFLCCTLSRVMDTFSSFWFADVVSSLKNRALGDTEVHVPPGDSPLMPLREEALLEEEEESDVRRLSTLRDLLHSSGSSLFLGPHRPLRWGKLNRSISLPTEEMGSVSTEFGDLAGVSVPEAEALLWASHWSSPAASAGRGILALVTVAAWTVSGCVRPGRAAEAVCEGTRRLRLLLSGS